MKPRTGILMAVKLILILSLAVLLYSAFQVIKAPIDAHHALQDWQKKREEAAAPALSGEETPLLAGMATFPHEEAESEWSYPPGAVIGEITFPSLNKKAAVLEGTESPQLSRGAGHYKSSASVGAAGNSVLAGHRDTVFRRLGELKLRDLIEVETAAGKFIYEVTGSSIVDGDERGAIKHSEDAVLTLITCYPFSYIGSAPDRYLLSAKLVQKEPLLHQPSVPLIQHP